MLYSDVHLWNINIDDPRYLTWWKSDVHLPKAKAYSAEWSAFIEKKWTVAEVFEQGRKMMAEQGIKVNY